MHKKIKRGLINFILFFLRLYWFIVRPSVRGVKVLLECEGKILLVKHNYGHSLWTIPGGGLKRGELSEIGAIREVYEELGVTLYRVVYLGQYETNYEYKKTTVDCFRASIPKEVQIKIDNFEIDKYAWFSIDSIPEDRAISVTKIISLYETQRV